MNLKNEVGRTLVITMQVSEQKLKKVVFFGSDAICLPALGWLKRMHESALSF